MQMIGFLGEKRAKRRIWDEDLLSLPSFFITFWMRGWGFDGGTSGHQDQLFLWRNVKDRASQAKRRMAYKLSLQEAK